MNRKKVRVWMVENDIRISDLAQEYGCDQSFLSHWLKGKRESRALEEFLVSKGCPEEYIVEKPDAVEAV